MRLGYAILIVTAILLCCEIAEAAPGSALVRPRSWNGLDPGPYMVGFRSIERYDYSRTFRAKRSPEGILRTGERARPVLMYLWYPAEAASDAPRMVYGEYSFASPADPAFFPILSRIQEREIYSTLYPFFGGRRGSVVDLMNVEMGAIRDAKQLARDFPSIVYHTDLRGGAGENALLCEYLASHGYIVATAHSIGGMLRDPGTNAEDLEDLVRDKEFVCAELRSLPQTDPEKLALVGKAFGGFTALVLTMRNTDIDAVVTLGEWMPPEGRAELVSQCSGFNPDRMSVPLLSIGTNEQAVSIRGAIDSLTHADRCLVTMSGGHMSDFSHYGALAAALPGAVPSERDSSYARLCRMVREFLDGHVRGSAEALSFLENAARSPLPSVVSVRMERGTPAPLREEEIVAVFWEEGVTAGIELLERLQAGVASPPVQTTTLNALGYQFLTAQRLEDAVEIFRTGSKLFPGSANAWASLGEACMYSDRADEARSCFRKVLDLLSIDTALDERAREALHKQAEAMLKRLGG